MKWPTLTSFQVFLHTQLVTYHPYQRVGAQPHKSSGCDNVRNKVLKYCASLLSSIFQKSLNAGAFPTIWKSVNSCPIHKGGSETSVQNFTITSTLVGPRVWQLVLIWCAKFLLVNYLPICSEFVSVLCFNVFLMKYFYPVIGACVVGCVQNKKKNKKK